MSLDVLQLSTKKDNTEHGDIWFDRASHLNSFVYTDNGFVYSTSICMHRGLYACKVYHYNKVQHSPGQVKSHSSTRKKLNGLQFNSTNAYSFKDIRGAHAFGVYNREQCKHDLLIMLALDVSHCFMSTQFDINAMVPNVLKG